MKQQKKHVQVKLRDFVETEIYPLYEECISLLIESNILDFPITRWSLRYYGLVFNNEVRKILLELLKKSLKEKGYRFKVTWSYELKVYL